MNDFHFDFAVLLTLLTFITGVGWALDKWWLGPRRRARGEDQPGAVLDFCRSFFPVIAAVLILRSFVAEPFRIPSGSMIPTLQIGDFILVNKFTYGLRDPVFHTKLVPIGTPERGDIVVFRWPVDPSKDFIKRIVGLPGDHIRYQDKQLFINGQVAPLEPDGQFEVDGPVPLRVWHRYTENLLGVPHQIMVNPSREADDFEFVVPAGQYFTMGDNRDGSDDSRRWGTVPEENLVGKAFFIWMSWDATRFRINFSRIGTVLK